MNKKDIIDELNKSRNSKQPLKESNVDGDLIATIQVANRTEDYNYSEMSLYEVEDCYFVALHKHKNFPSPEQVLNGTKVLREPVDYDYFHCILSGIMYYRVYRLYEYDTNTYSFLCGWCASKGYNLNRMLNV